MSRARIAIVDDHPMVREHLGILIKQQEDMEVCGEAVVDLSLKNSSGLDLVKDLRVTAPEVRILVISMHDENLYAERSIRSGAHGYVSKQEGSAEIIAAIRLVLSGKIYMSRALSEKIVSRALGQPGEQDHAIQRLADREFQVFDLIGQGYSSREIARHLGLETKTIETYRLRIRDKLNLASSSELLRSAVAWRRDANAV